MDPEETSLTDAFVEHHSSDNAFDMSIPAARPNWEQHPLFLDRGRLETITDLMWLEIQKRLYPRTARRPLRRPAATEQALIGGASAEDVLREAVASLLQYEDREGVGWEGLAITIARRRAVDALRTATRSRTLPDGTEIGIVSLDSQDDDGPHLAETLADPDDPPDERAVDSVMRAQRLHAIGRAAQTLLTPRDRDIFYRVTRGEKNVTIAAEVGLTQQRIGQIYADSIRKINAALRLDPKLRRLYDDVKGETPNEQ